VIAIARLTLSNTAADSGVRLEIILVLSSFGIRSFLGLRLNLCFGARRPRRDSLSIARSKVRIPAGA